MKKISGTYILMKHYFYNTHTHIEIPIEYLICSGKKQFQDSKSYETLLEEKETSEEASFMVISFALSCYMLWKFLDL